MRYRILLAASLLLVLPSLARAQNQKPKRTKPVSKTVKPQAPAANTVLDLSGRTQLDAGKTLNLLRIDGSAQVTALQMKIEPADRYTLRQTLIRIFWDNADKPAVEVPIGDFFGSPFGDARFQSRFLAGKENGSLCTFPMVFRKSMRVELANLGKTPLNNIQWKLAYTRLESVPPTAPYFHAQWTRHTSEPNKPLMVGQISGNGHIAGIAVALQNKKPDFAPLSDNTAQVRITTDNAETPKIAENLTIFFAFNSLFITRGSRTNDLNGITLTDKTVGRMGGYSLFLNNALAFSQNVRAEMTFSAAVDVATTLFWYQAAPTPPAEPLKAADLTPARFHLPNVIEAESLSWDGGNPTQTEDRGFKAEASNGIVTAFAKGTAAATFPVAAEDVYILNIAALVRPGATLKYRYALDNEELSELMEAALDPLDAETTSLWINSVPIHLKPGTHKIKLQPQGEKPLFLDYLELFPSRKVEDAVEVENLVDIAKVTEMTVLTRNDDLPEFSGNSFLRWDKVPAQAELSVPLEIPQDGDYTLDLGILRDSDCPKLTVKLDGREIGEVDTFIANRDIDVQPLRVGTIKNVTAGKHTLTLVVKEIRFDKPLCTLNFDYTKIKRVSP